MAPHINAGTSLLASGQHSKNASDFQLLCRLKGVISPLGTESLTDSDQRPGTRMSNKKQFSHKVGNNATHGCVQIIINMTPNGPKLFCLVTQIATVMQMGNKKRDTKKKKKNHYLQVTLPHYFHHPGPTILSDWVRNGLSGINGSFVSGKFWFIFFFPWSCLFFFRPTSHHLVVVSYCYGKHV